MDSTATLLKVAYAEGVKSALLEHGIDEMTASEISEEFTNAKLSGVKDVASMIGEAAKNVAGKARDVGTRGAYAAKNVAGKARDVGTRGAYAAKDVAKDVADKARMEGADAVQRLKYLEATNPMAFYALMGGAGAIGGGVGAGVYTLAKRKSEKE